MKKTIRTTLTRNQLCATVDEVSERFAASLLEVNGKLGLTTRELNDAAKEFSRVFWRTKNGRINQDSSVFLLGQNITLTAQALSLFMSVSDREVLNAFLKNKTLVSRKPEVVAASVLTLIEMIYVLKDQLVPFEHRLHIKNRRAAFDYLFNSRGLVLVGRSSKNLEKYRRYGQLVRNKHITHQSYVLSSGSSGVAILNMPIEELNKRLSEYDARRIRADAALAARASTEPRKKPATVVDLSSSAAKRMAAEKFLARRAALQEKTFTP